MNLLAPTRKIIKRARKSGLSLEKITKALNKRGISISKRTVEMRARELAR